MRLPQNESSRSNFRNKIGLDPPPPRTVFVNSRGRSDSYNSSTNLETAYNPNQNSGRVSKSARYRYGARDQNVMLITGLLTLSLLLWAEGEPGPFWHVNGDRDVKGRHVFPFQQRYARQGHGAGCSSQVCELEETRRV